MCFDEATSSPAKNGAETLIINMEPSMSPGQNDGVADETLQPTNSPIANALDNQKMQNINTGLGHRDLILFSLLLGVTIVFSLVICILWQKKRKVEKLHKSN